MASISLRLAFTECYRYTDWIDSSKYRANPSSNCSHLLGKTCFKSNSRKLLNLAKWSEKAKQTNCLIAYFPTFLLVLLFLLLVQLFLLSCSSSYCPKLPTLPTFSHNCTTLFLSVCYFFYFLLLSCLLPRFVLIIGQFSLPFILFPPIFCYVLCYPFG